LSAAGVLQSAQRFADTLGCELEGAEMPFNKKIENFEAAIALNFAY
jgi:hypothetical protein